MSSSEGAQAPSSFERIVSVHGKLSDQGWVWFPFLFLKPEPHVLITPSRRIAMTLCFGCYFSLSWPLWQWASGEDWQTRSWALFLVKCLAFFAIWFRLVTTPLWNRRAIGLQATGR